MNKKELLSMAAFIHNANDPSSFYAVLKKLIDFSFYINNTTKLSVEVVVNFLDSEEGIGMNFSPHEIIECCKQFEPVYKLDNPKRIDYIEITEEYLKEIQEKTDIVKLDVILNDFYINTLTKEYRKLYSFKKVEEVINIFLFNMLKESEYDYAKLINDKESVFKRQRIGYEFIPIINQFIKWENTFKNSILERIYNVGIEFAIINSKIVQIETDVFQGKNLYLDTNILFKILGFNGKDNCYRMEIFVKKFIKHGMRLSVSSVTKAEFSTTIQQKIEFISNNLKDSRKFTLYDYSKDHEYGYNIYNYFFDWREKSRHNLLRNFKTYIDVQVNKFYEKYNVNVEKSMIKTVFKQEVADYYVQTYNDYKPSSRKGRNIIKNDVFNYVYVMGLRDKEEIHNLSTTQIFLLSTDYELIGFDNYQRLNSRVVIHPARLYALILKVMGRVNKSELDSFIKLIKIDINSEQWISDETMALLNEQLNFYESDTGMQKPYIEAIMESQILQEVDRLPIEQKSEYINRIFEKTSLELAAKEKDRADQAENLISETNERYISTKRQRDIMIAVIVTLFLAIVALLLIFLVLPTLEYNEKTTNQIRIGISSIVIIPTVYKFLKWSIIKIIRKFDKKINK